MREIPSPVKRWPGKVLLPDFLTFPQFSAFREALDAASEEPNSLKSDQLLLPGIMACVEKWELNSGFPENVTAQTFPATPLKASVKLIRTLRDELLKIIVEEEEIPNA